ncbi:MAG: hypothetical protein ABIJ81_02185 [Patescibacteria group bacterium]
MIDQKYFQSLKKQYNNTTVARRKLISLSGEAQHLAKRAIFALQRDQLKEAQQLISQARSLVQAGTKLCHQTDELEFQGSYRAAQEELVEATLFYNFLSTGKVGSITGFKVPLEVYLAGLTDLVGELSRLAVTRATVGDQRQVKKIAETATTIVSELVEMNLVGYLRTKADQARGALRRLQDILYDLSLKVK